MKYLPIYLFDSSRSKEEIENEELGFEKNKVIKQKRVKLQTFNFREEKLDGFWIDPEKHDHTGTIDIVFYINGNEFRTPYTKMTETILLEILNTTWK